MRTRFEEICMQIGGGGVIFFKNTTLWLGAILGAGFGRGKNAINKSTVRINKSVVAINKSIVSIIKSVVSINKSYPRINKSIVRINKSIVAINKTIVSIIKSTVRINKSYPQINKTIVSINKSIGLGTRGIRRFDGSHSRFGSSHLRFDGSHLRFGGSHLRFDGSHLRFGGSHLRFDGSHLGFEGILYWSGGMVSNLFYTLGSLNVINEKMKKGTISLLLSLITFFAFGQTCQTKEIKLTYSNALEVFTICEGNPQITFNDKYDYYWYTEYSKIKHTKGGAGGNLLHGVYKFYDEKGNLLEIKNYYLGLLDGVCKSWDSLGNITSINKYKKGEWPYSKFINKDQQGKKYWIEMFGIMDTIRYYTLYGTLTEEKYKINDTSFDLHEKIYYENSNQIHEEFNGDNYSKFGKYVSYYENGKIKEVGEYYGGECRCTNLPIGIWKAYKLDGTIDSELQFKVEETKWENGNRKMIGGYLFNPNTKTWVKQGTWRWFKEENGHGDYDKEYNLDAEVTK